MNLYATIADIQGRLGASGNDAIFAAHLEDASRTIDTFCRRQFYVSTGTRFFDAYAFRDETAYIDDFLSLTSLTTDSEDDNTFDGETWVEGTDWTAKPYNSYPKFGIYRLRDGGFAMPERTRYIKATGEWGYANSTTPYDATEITGTVATVGGTTLTLSADEVVQAGHTILIDSERMYVSATTEGECTVVRAVNGSTAAAHSEAAISIYTYPPRIVGSTLALAIALYRKQPRSGFTMERIGDYQYTQEAADSLGVNLTRLVGPYQRKIG